MVAWLGAVQAQEYLAALWAIGLRLPDATEETVERAIANREIVRTWPMRGTLHFVAAADIHWLLELMAPRVIARLLPRYRQLELDERTIGLALDVLREELAGGRLLGRAELAGALVRRGISPVGQRLSHLLGRAQLERVVCHGPRRGKQTTFTLLDEWVPPGGKRGREEALAELAGRYFRSHGPATLHDFVWWSGLTTAEARTGIAGAGSRLASGTAQDAVHWWGAEDDGVEKSPPSGTHLLPAFDEYVVAYRDRRAIQHRILPAGFPARGGILNPVVIAAGQVVGTWRRTVTRQGVRIEPLWLAGGLRPDDAEDAARRYADFLRVPLAGIA